MSATLPPPPLPAGAPPAPAPAPAPSPAPARAPVALEHSRRGVPRLLLRLARGVKSWLLAALACLSIPFALVFAGWTCRLVQRRALTRWARQLGTPLASPRLLPLWVVSEHFRDDLHGRNSKPTLNRLRGLARAFFASLAANFRTGFLVVLNSMIVTLPGGLIMLFSWYAGWDNSFNKGYEQAAVGPLWGVAGIFLFMAAMTYVPIAQARQAVTGSARAFWNYRKVRDVIHRRPLACLLLIASSAALGFVFMISVSTLMFIGQGDQFAAMPPSEIIAFLNRYYFWWAALFLVPGYLALKLFAGWIYSAAVGDAVRRGEWLKDELRGAEAAALLPAPVEVSPPPLPGLMHTSLRAFTALGRLTLRTLTFLLLLGFAFELYVAQFFNFEPAVNWLRQPLVQLPWYHHIPGHLRE